MIQCSWCCNGDLSRGYELKIKREIPIEEMKEKNSNVNVVMILMKTKFIWRLNRMDFYIMEIRKIISINGKDIVFNYKDTYFDKQKAIQKAKELSEDENILKICIFHWFLNRNGVQYMIDGSIPYYYLKETQKEIVNE